MSCGYRASDMLRIPVPCRRRTHPPCGASIDRSILPDASLADILLLSSIFMRMGSAADNSKLATRRSLFLVSGACDDGGHVHKVTSRRVRGILARRRCRGPRSTVGRTGACTVGIGLGVVNAKPWGRGKFSRPSGATYEGGEFMDSSSLQAYWHRQG